MTILDSLRIMICQFVPEPRSDSLSDHIAGSRGPAETAGTDPIGAVSRPGPAWLEGGSTPVWVDAGRV